MERYCKLSMDIEALDARLQAEVGWWWVPSRADGGYPVLQRVGPVKSTGWCYGCITHTYCHCAKGDLS
jgi:hypothetical protein